MKLPKKVSIKTLYNLGIIVLLAGILYAFYGVYSRAADYWKSRSAPQKQAAQPQPMSPPVFFRFAPPPQQAYRYAVFTMNRAKAQPAKNQPGGKISGFDILGVVKRDRLFLVVRTKPTGKIKLVSRGEAVNGDSSVKELTTSQVVITDKMGGEKTHKIFAFKGVTEQTKRQDNRKKQNKKKQTQINQGRSF